MVPWLIENFFAGTWQMIWHWGVGVGLIIICLLCMWFLPVWKKDFLYAAIVVATALLFEAVGIHDERAHVIAQQHDLQNRVDKIIQSTKTPAARKAHDRFDSPKF
jgi:hypothetical protein